MDTDDLYSSANLDSQLEHYDDDRPSAPAEADVDDQAMYDDDESESSGDDEVEDDLSILMRAWINERSAPELLEYEGAAIENLMELVDFQRQKLASQQAFVANILQMDVDRVKFLVRSYLRTRLAKIERHARHYLGEPMYRDRMAQSELDYATGFVELDNGHVRRSFLDQLPPHLRGLDEVSAEGLDMVTKPDVDEAVFCRVRVTVGEFQFETSEDPIVMRRNNIFITRYSIIRDLLEDGKVELI